MAHLLRREFSPKSITSQKLQSMAMTNSAIKSKELYLLCLCPKSPYLDEDIEAQYSFGKSEQKPETSMMAWQVLLPPGNTFSRS